MRLLPKFGEPARNRVAMLAPPFDLASIGPPYCICDGQIVPLGVALDDDGLPAIIGQITTLLDVGIVGCCEDES